MWLFFQIRLYRFAISHEEEVFAHILGDRYASCMWCTVAIQLGFRKNLISCLRTAAAEKLLSTQHLSIRHLLFILCVSRLAYLRFLSVALYSEWITEKRQKVAVYSYLVGAKSLLEACLECGCFLHAGTKGNGEKDLRFCLNLNMRENYVGNRRKVKDRAFLWTKK